MLDLYTDHCNCYMSPGYIPAHGVWHHTAHLHPDNRLPLAANLGNHTSLTLGSNPLLLILLLASHHCRAEAGNAGLLEETDRSHFQTP